METLKVHFIGIIWIDLPPPGTLPTLSRNNLLPNLIDLVFGLYCLSSSILSRTLLNVTTHKTVISDSPATKEVCPCFKILSRDFWNEATIRSIGCSCWEAFVTMVAILVVTGGEWLRTLTVLRLEVVFVMVWNNSKTQVQREEVYFLFPSVGGIWISDGRIWAAEWPYQ